MNKFRSTLMAFAALAFILAVSSSAQAQATRTWVSGVGDDANPCSRTAPCKTYAGAISKTARDGEISTLDPGGFGAITITKSITINGTTGQGYGSILASLTNGVTVNITDPADTRKTVRLNWLDINGAPNSSPGLTGIRILAANAVHVENTVIDSFRSTSAGFGHGINIVTGAFTEVTLRNVVVRGSLNAGVRVEATAGGVQVLLSVNNCSFYKNGDGIKVVNGGRLMIRDSEFISNGTTGLDAEETTSDTFVNVENSTFSLNATGIQAGAGASVVRLSNNVIMQNGTGVSTAGGSFVSFGNNKLTGNVIADGTLPAPIGQS